MGFSNTFCKKLNSFPNLIEINMSFKQVKDSGLIELAKLEKLEKLITSQDSLISVTQNGLTNFFGICKNLKFVDISGSSAINTEAIQMLADNNENLSHLYLDTYLLPGSVIKYVINKCKIEVFKFTPSLIITKDNIPNIRKYC